MPVSFMKAPASVAGFAPRCIMQEPGSMSIAVEKVGKVSNTFVEGVQEQAKAMNISFPGGVISAKLHRAGELGDVVELRGLHPDTEVAETIFTQRGYGNHVVGKSYCSNLSEFPQAVSDAYTGFLKIVSGGNWLGSK